MAKSQFRLFTTKRFAPFFLTQFLGAINDNVLKNALIALITFRLAEKLGGNATVLINEAAGLLIIPFFLFSAIAGQLADSYDKALITRRLKATEILIVIAATIGFYFNNVYGLMFTLFLMGTQSAFFGPVKYAILPDHLKDDELIGGNALVSMGTFIAILLGTIIGSIGILRDHGVAIIGGLMIVVAFAGWISSTAIPKAPPKGYHKPINFNFLLETWRIIKAASSIRSVFLSILGISWFWLFGATYLTQIPSYTKNILNADETVSTMFMLMFSIGIGVGSMFCNKLLNGEITARFVPAGAIGMTLFSLDLYFASGSLTINNQADLVSISAFVQDANNWRFMLDFLMIAICGGLYIVPLISIMQTSCKDEERAQIIAANNIMNALFMVFSALIAIGLTTLGYSVPQIFLTIACANLLVTLYILRLLPDATLRVFFAVLFKILFRVKIKGIDNLKNLKEPAVIIANHVSFLDGILLGAFLPGEFTFAISSRIAKKWWVKPLISIIDCFPIDPTKPLTTKSLIKRVKEGKSCVIFPEGRITVTGALMKIYEGPGLIADKSQAPIVPVRINGAQFSKFSKLKGKIKLSWFPKITLSVMPPVKFEVPDDVKGRKRRELVGLKLYDLMAEMMFGSCNIEKTLFKSLQEATEHHGKKHVILEDIEFSPVTYGQLLKKSRILGKVFAKRAKKGQFMGLLLPNSIGCAVTFFAMQAAGIVPAMLNFSVGLTNLISACKAAQIKTIITSRRFVDAALSPALMEGLAKEVDIVYLEDLKSEIGLFTLLFPLKPKKALPEDPAVVLFTSGSEGTPKGVVLSHKNLTANRLQLAAKIDFNSRDIVFNALPVFHSFGLTAGMLLPILSGIKTFLYPSPLHYRIVPELVYSTCATIMFGTDTFLSGYAKMAHSYDFFNIRYTFAGAEKVKEETKRTYMEKFGVRILEGYGATETAPVIAINTPMAAKAGSVGRALPGIELKLESVPGIETGGKLLVKGPNIMKGYLKTDNPGIIQPIEDSWYDTGDIVELDLNNFITIKGRAKRFAKIAGEMISLTAVEGILEKVWAGYMHAVINLPDEKKGEKLVVLTNYQEASSQNLNAATKGMGFAEIMIPKDIRVVKEIPLLGTGKIDYPRVKEMVE